MRYGAEILVTDERIYSLVVVENAKNGSPKNGSFRKRSNKKARISALFAFMFLRRL